MEEHEQHGGERCGCEEHGEHEHGEHEHEHGHGHGEAEYGAVRVERRRHDEAVVISGSLALYGEYGAVRPVLEREISGIAEKITALGGIIGHVKASCAVTATEMYSVTDAGAGLMVKKPPQREIKISLVAIVFAVPEEEAEQLVYGALEKVLEAGRQSA